MAQAISNTAYKCQFCTRIFFTERGAMIHENKYCKHNKQKRPRVNKEDPRLGVDLFKGVG